MQVYSCRCHWSRVNLRNFARGARSHDKINPAQALHTLSIHADASGSCIHVSKQAHIVDFEQARKSASKSARPQAGTRSKSSGTTRRRGAGSSAQGRPSASRKGSASRSSSTHSATRTPSRDEIRSSRSSEPARTSTRRPRATTRPSKPAPAPARNPQSRRHALTDAQVTRAARASAEARVRTHSSARSDDASERRGRQDQRKKTFVEQVRDRQHAARKKRADKVFDKTVKHDAAPADNAGSRAALYKGEMGSTHKKAARMQAEQGASSRVRTVKAP